MFATENRCDELLGDCFGRTLDNAGSADRHNTSTTRSRLLSSLNRRLGAVRSVSSGWRLEQSDQSHAVGSAQLPALSAAPKILLLPRDNGKATHQD